MNLFRILFLIIISFYSSLSFATIKLNHGWEYQWEGDGDSWQEYPDVKTPLVNQNKFLWLRVKLPSPCNFEMPALNIRIKTEFEAYTNGMMIFTYHKNWILENARGGVRHFITIPYKAENTEYVYFKVASGGRQVGLEGDVFFDEHTNLLKTIISKDENRFILGIILCFFSSILLIVAFVTKELSLFYIFGFGFNLGIWTFSFCHEETQKTLLGGVASFWDSAMYLSSYFAIIFVLLFIVDINNIIFKKTLRFFKNMHIFFTTVVLLSSMFSIITLRSANLIFNIMLIPTSFLIVVATILSSFKGDRESRIILIGFIVMGFCIMMDSLSYTDSLEILKSETPRSQWGLVSIFISIIIIWIERYNRFLREYHEAQKHAAISQLTQMLAHDVRKPFGILRVVLSTLRRAGDYASVKEILATQANEVDKALISVDGLIADVMEVRSPSTQLMMKPMVPEQLIKASLLKCFYIYPESDVSLYFEFKHYHMVNVHEQKIARVFANIIINSLQAMKLKGRIWFRTREVDFQIEFCIGNAGQFISQESLSKLFDEFYTSGKECGTGLGLTIAHKVVHAHGGRIWCESSKTLDCPDGKVEFFFTLPIAGELLNNAKQLLPKHSSDFF